MISFLLQKFKNKVKFSLRKAKRILEDLSYNSPQVIIEKMSREINVTEQIMDQKQSCIILSFSSMKTTKPYIAPLSLNKWRAGEKGRFLWFQWNQKCFGERIKRIERIKKWIITIICKITSYHCQTIFCESYCKALNDLESQKIHHKIFPKKVDVDFFISKGLHYIIWDIF